MSDPLGPTGNTNPVCPYCGNAHHAFAACDQYELKQVIHLLQAENQRLKSLLGRWLVEDDRGPRAVKRVNETAEAIGWNQEEVRDE